MKTKAEKSPIQKAIDIEDQIIGNIKEQYYRKDLHSQQSVKVSISDIVGNICLAFQRGVAYGREQRSEPEDELREETKQKLAEENKDSTWKGHSQGYYYHFIEGWDACIDYLKSFKP